MRNGGGRTVAAATVIALLCLGLATRAADGAEAVRDPKGGPPPASEALAGPWPDPADVGHIAATPVSYPSHSPFTLADVGTGPERDPPTTARATLFLPPPATADRLVPAVILLHGAGGVLASRELTYGRQLAAMGIAALVVDAFAARRQMASGFVDRLLKITEAMLLADAYSGLRYLAARAEIDATRVVLVGFSYGGMAATYGAYAAVAERLAPDGPRFAGHVAFYAPCIASFDDNRATGAPVLMLFGEEDAIVDPLRCAIVARELEAGGARVQVVSYPNAYHQWDGGFTTPRRIGRNLAGCRFEVDHDGTVRDGHTFLPLSSPFLRKVSLALCADSEGYLIGRDDRIRALSNEALGTFLHRVFDRAGERVRARER